jgi:hypothetical protein
MKQPKRKPTQMDRVLAAARSYRGTCQAEWIAARTPDGGPQITRVGARIQDLEDKRGCVFEIVGWRHGTRVYRLVEDPEDGVGRHASAPTTPSGTPLVGVVEASASSSTNRPSAHQATRQQSPGRDQRQGPSPEPLTVDGSPPNRLFELPEPSTSHYDVEKAA